MVVDISHIIDTGIGVILGGLITLGVNLYLQKMERKTQYGWWYPFNVPIRVAFT